jgi:hypothetical protein
VKHREHQTYRPGTAGLRRLIEFRLKARLRDETSSKSFTPHPDEDMVNALVEGQLRDAESRYLVSHLVNCASCLHLTAEMVRRMPEINEISDLNIDQEKPGPLQRLLGSVAGWVPAIKEDAVFAYQEKEEPGESEKKDTDTAE